MKAILKVAKSFILGILPIAVKQFLRSLLFQVKRSFLLRKAVRVRSRLVNQHPDRKTILFFAPEAGVTPYLMVQAIIGKTLQEKKHNVIFVRCFDLLRRCPVKEMVRLPYDATPKQSIDVCLNCWRASDRILSQYELDYVDVRELVNDAAKQKILNALKSLPDNRIEYCYENISVGNLAFYDFAIANKHPAKKPIASQEYFIFDQYLETVMMALEMMKAIVLNYKVDTLGCFDEYGMMSAVRIYVRERNVKPLMVSIAYHLNGDWRRVMGMSNLSIVKEQAWRIDQWPNWRNMPLSEKIVKEVADDLIFRLTSSGSHIYSTNKTLQTEELFKQMGLAVNRKTLVAFTSSTDEHDALLYGIRALGYADLPSRGAFGDTFVWLHSLIEYVETSDDLQLIIRLHPRIAVTARDNVTSKDYQRYREAFSGPYEHTKLVWPEEKISSYDLAEFADIALVTWSSMGQELARLGLPVLSGYPSIFSLAPNDGFIVTALEKNEYFESLRRLLNTNSPAHISQMIRLSYRWYQMSNLGNSIDLSDVVGGRVMMKLPPFKLSKNADIVEEVFINHKDAIDFNLKKFTVAQSVHSLTEESHALAGQLGRLIVFFCTGNDHAKTVAITVVDKIELGKHTPNELLIEGNFVEYVEGNVIYKKYSPLVARLGAAYSELTSTSKS